MKVYSYARRGAHLVVATILCLSMTACEEFLREVGKLPGVGTLTRSAAGSKSPKAPPLEPILRDIRERFKQASELKRKGPGYEDSGRAIVRAHKPDFLLIREKEGLILYRHMPADMKPAEYREIFTRLISEAGNSGSGEMVRGNLSIRYAHVFIKGRHCLVSIGYRTPGVVVPTKILTNHNLKLFGSVLVLCLGGVLLLIFVIMRFSGKTASPKADPKWHGEEREKGVPPPPEPSLRLEAMQAMAGDREDAGETEDEIERETAPTIGAETVPLDFEQERWNLPGYLSLADAVATPPGVGEMDFIGGGAGSMFVGRSLFDRRFYRLDQGGYSDAYGELESLSREFMTELGDRFAPTQVLLYLRNTRNRLYPLLLARGNVFVSGSFIDRENPPADVLEKMEEGQCVVAEDGRSLHLPVLCRGGLLGVVFIEGESSLYNRESLSRMWSLVRKFGETLYQAKIHEQAVMDGESTLRAGMAFHHELRHEYSLQRELAGKRGLLLIQFQGAGDPVHMRTLGLALRALFSERERLYRVALDVFAVLGPLMDAETLERRTVDYLNYVRNHQNVSVSAGYAVLDGQMESPADWFDRAARALDEAAAAGKNYYRVYSRPNKAVLGQR